MTAAIDEHIKYSIVVCNGSELACRGLEFVLDSMVGVNLVGCAVSTAEALTLLVKHQPDLVITDLKSSTVDGLHITNFAKNELSKTKILIITVGGAEELILDVLCSGADGLCLYDVSAAKIQLAITSVLSGAFWLDQSLANFMKHGIQRFRASNQGTSTSPMSELSGLTEREISVLELIALAAVMPKYL